VKKILTFIPLGIAIIYIFNVIEFRVINNSATLLQILSNLKIYLYISIAGFVFYFLIKILAILQRKKSKVEESQEQVNYDSYEPFEEIKTNNINLNDSDSNSYVPNYDYVPMYHEEKKGNYLNEEQKKESIAIKEDVISSDYNNKNNITSEIKNEENSHDLKPNNKLLKFCYKCGEELYKTDSYCSYCGASQYNKGKNINPILKNIINVLEIVILILIIYFSLNMLFDYKESKDPNFKSPFKVSMTK